MKKATEMFTKTSTEAHRGPLYYINTNHRIKKQPKMMSATDYAKYKRTLAIAHQMSQTRSRGRMQRA